MELRKDRNARLDLRDRVAGSPLGPELPLVHMTLAGHARDIIDAGRIQARRCRVFERDLVYFFFGKPAYRYKGDLEKEDLVYRFPAAFLLDPAKVGHHHVYPFDTGAAKLGLYRDADQTLGIVDYELMPDQTSPQRMLQWAFHDVDAYMRSDVKGELTGGVPEFDQVTQSFERIARRARPGTNLEGRYDGRAVSIEVATNQDVSLGDAVDCVILPEAFLESKGKTNRVAIDSLNGLGVETLTYEWAPHRTPHSYKSEIEALIRSRFAP